MNVETAAKLKQWEQKLEMALTGLLDEICYKLTIICFPASASGVWKDWQSSFQISVWYYTADIQATTKRKKADNSGPASMYNFTTSKLFFFSSDHL